MSNRREIVKSIFQRLFEEIAPLVSSGYSIDKAMAEATFTPVFASEADKYGILRFILRDDLKSVKPLAELTPEQLGANLDFYFREYQRMNNGKSEFEVTTFDEFWTKAEHEVLDYQSSMTRYVGLVNVYTSGNSFALPGGAVLRPPEEADHLWVSQFGNLPTFMHIKSVIQIDYETRLDRGIQGNARLPVHELFRFAIALQQNVAAGEAFVVDRVNAIRMHGNMSQQEGANPWGRPLFLKQNDGDDIAFFMRRLQEETATGDDRARRIRRAAQSYQRAMMRRVDGIGEQLIDAWIALEGLFGEKYETTAALSFRIPAFVEIDGAKRRHLWQQMRDDYEKRSRYIHGGDIAENDLPARSAINIASRALRRVLEEPSPYPHAPREIELRFLESGTL
jgi:Apea-like HEPN